YPRTTEPELDANSLASLGIESTLLSSSEMPRRFHTESLAAANSKGHLPALTDQGAHPNQIARIEPPDIQRVKRDERRDRQYAEASVIPSMMATRSGSRAARNNITLNVSTIPPISFTTAK